jgi:hypothetical protein
MKTTKGAVKRRDNGAPVATPQPASPPTAIIESQLSSPDEPVLGLYLHVAYHCFMASFEDIVGRGEITPNLVYGQASRATPQTVA